jgi:FHA domain-containing protein
MMGSDREANNRPTSIPGISDRSADLDFDNIGTQIPGRTVLAKLRIVDGPGAGTSHVVYPGDNAIGRSPQNRVSLAFGDDSIHREVHALIHARAGSFSLQHGGKPNAVYVNGEKLSGSLPIKLGDQITLGATTLRLDPP